MSEPADSRALGVVGLGSMGHGAARLHRRGQAAAPGLAEQDLFGLRRIDDQHDYHLAMRRQLG